MTKTFCNLEALATISAGALGELLTSADWSAFVPARDLPALRARLERLEREEGVTSLHRLASERVLRGARFLLAAPHGAAITAFAMSPCGRYLATGSESPHDDYRAGGVLLIWEIATGRVVRAFERIEGGVGWTEHIACMQWSASGRWLGVAFNTNVVGVFDSFEGEPFQFEGVVTDGWDSPPAWCFAPDEAHLFIAAWGPDEAPGCVVPFADGGVFYDDSDEVRWLAAQPKDEDDGEHADLQPFKWVRWSPDGAHVYGHNNHDQAYAIDAKTGALRYRTQVEPPVAWSPDGARIAHNPAGLVFYDGRSGLPTLDLPMIVGAGAVVFSPDGARLAMLVHADNTFGADPGVHVFEGREVRASLELRPAKGHWMFPDACAFAFSPDGVRGACLTDQGTIEVWSLGADAKRLVTIEGVEGGPGLAWGAGDTLVGVGRGEVAFWDAKTGALRSRHSMLAPPGYAGPPTQLGPYWGTALVLALPTEQGWAWVVANEGGEMVCPPDHRAAVAPAASFVVDNRFAWPWAWAVGTPLAPVYDDDAAVPQGSPLRNRIRPTREVAGAPFVTVEAGDPRPKGADPWAETLHEQRQGLIDKAQLLSFELNALPATHYRAMPTLRGKEITKERLEAYVGKVVMFAEAWRPEHVTIGVLAAMRDGYFEYYYESRQGSSGGGGQTLAELAWIGPAVPV
ncbi:hypothetical protein [Polyangium sp. 6x1]|uniref:WD40 repeat domain-containing protein n=1 Tax=Polyangium sp. 6x1 TaxID=3042689 RepID=UPI0024828807|nr:hypothetical protein [Polyangium sp. 6x1]MDI1443582.1 hypothetical protein [Polyangium sp. 6x1]